MYCHTGTVAALVSGQCGEVGSCVSRGSEFAVFILMLPIWRAAVN